MKTLCLGGSFNPIHHAHLICARSVAESGGFDQILLIPTGQSPHKLSNELAGAMDRLAMCELVVKTQGSKNGPKFAITDIETRRTGPSYTIETVLEFKRAGWPDVHWLIGADMLNYLPKWHRLPDLLAETTFEVVARPGQQVNLTELPLALSKLRANLRSAPLLDISSTDIRQRVANGLPIDFLTPQPVVEYIAKHGLYRS